MYWLILGLAAAVGDAGVDAVTKRFFSHLSPYGMALVRLLFPAPLLVLAALWFGLPPLDQAFYLTLAPCCPWRWRPCSCT